MSLDLADKKIIITGGQSVAQLNTAYEFITGFIRMREDSIGFAR